MNEFILFKYRTTVTLNWDTTTKPATQLLTNAKLQISVQQITLWKKNLTKHRCTIFKETFKMGERKREWLVVKSDEYLLPITAHWVESLTRYQPGPTKLLNRAVLYFDAFRFNLFFTLSTYRWSQVSRSYYTYPNSTRRCPGCYVQELYFSQTSTNFSLLLIYIFFRPRNIIYRLAMQKFLSF